MNKLIIAKEKEFLYSCFFSGTELVEVSADRMDKDSLLGNIYLGKVKNIVKNINSAFVEIADKRMCYLPLSEKLHPVFPDGRKVQSLREGDELFVQVSKEDVKTKAPMVTTNFNLTGKYLVLVHGKSMIGVSGKVEEESVKKRLKKLVTSLISEDYGFIIRTNAAFAPDDMILTEAARLKEQYENLIKYGIHKSCFSLLYTALPVFLTRIRDGFSESLEEILTDDEQIFSQIANYLTEYQPEDAHKLRLFDDPLASLERIYGISHKVSQALNKKVWMKSGGTLVIEPTEALTVIDVNTGKAIHGKDADKTFYKLNAEAAKEIAKQIRLRNLSGIIIVDFINMESAEDKEKLLSLLRGYIKTDPIKTTVIDITALGLVEITRKKVRKPLHEQVFRQYAGDKEDNG